MWLQLCVLEDRLERLGALVELGTEFEPTLVKVGLRAGRGGQIRNCHPQHARDSAETGDMGSRGRSGGRNFTDLIRLNPDLDQSLETEP